MSVSRVFVYCTWISIMSPLNSGEVYAVGFCNAVKPVEAQEQLGVAAAEFYRGAGALATLLVGVEERDLKKVEDAGVEARDAFAAASEKYVEVIGSGVVGDELAEAVSAVDIEEALRLAPVPEGDPVIGEIAEFAKTGQVNEMLAVCSRQSELLAAEIHGVKEYATERALVDLEQRPFLELSSLWGQTLLYGTFVSAIFTVAEGEGP